MTLKRRVERLEARMGKTGNEPLVIIQQIVRPGNDGKPRPIAYLGRALTPDGWRTISCGPDVPQADFERRLAELARGSAA